MNLFRLSSSRRAALALLVAALGAVFGTHSALAAGTTTQLQITPTSTAVGDPITFTATVTSTSTPPGTVNFVNDATGIPLAPATVLAPASGTSATATLVTSELAAGSYAVHAVYVPVFPFSGSSSPSQIVTVNAHTLHDTLVTLTASSVQVDNTQPVTLTAVVTEVGSTFVPTGSVTFVDSGNGNGAPVPLGSQPLDATGTASLVVPDFAVGSHHITALYDGNDRDRGASASLDLTSHAPVDPRVATTTAVTVTPSLFTEDDTVTITARVSQVGTPTPPIGSDLVTFSTTGGYDVYLGEAPLVNGVATLQKGGWLPGSYDIQAEYFGNILYKGSSGHSSATVLGSRVASQLSYVGATTADYDDHVTLSALLTDTSGQPLTGHVVSLTLGGQSCNGVSGGDGMASCDIVVDRPAGPSTVTAAFAQDAFATGSAASATFIVTREQSTLAASASVTPSGTTLTGTLLEDGLTPIANGTISFGFGPAACTAVTNATGRASCTVPPLSGTSATLTASFGGDAFYAAASDTEVVPLSIATSVAYTGATTADYDDATTLSAKLIDNTGAAIASQLVTISAGSQTCTGTTSASGVASCSIVLAQPVGSYPVVVAFAGQALYLPSSATATFVVTREQSTVGTLVSGPVLDGSSVTLTATLLEDGLTPIGNRILTLTLGGAACTASTNAQGVATCAVPQIATLGPTVVGASFAGDASYLPASTSSMVTLYALAPGGGAFVVGDRTATGTVTFWDQQWWKSNLLSAVSAPSGFKGYAITPALPACGTTWSTDPGNSPPPPSTPLPSYLAVIVTSSASKTGSQVFGNTVHVVVVMTNPGYAYDPGHSGTGTVVATVC